MGDSVWTEKICSLLEIKILLRDRNRISSFPVFVLKVFLKFFTNPCSWNWFNNLALSSG